MAGRGTGRLVLEQLLTSCKRNFLCKWMERVLWKTAKDRKKTGKMRIFFGFFGPSGTLPAGDVKLFDFVACIT